MPSHLAGYRSDFAIPCLSGFILTNKVAAGNSEPTVHRGCIASVAAELAQIGNSYGAARC